MFVADDCVSDDEYIVGGYLLWKKMSTKRLKAMDMLRAKLMA